MQTFISQPVYRFLKAHTLPVCIFLYWYSQPELCAQALWSWWEVWDIGRNKEEGHRAELISGVLRHMTPVDRIARIAQNHRLACKAEQKEASSASAEVEARVLGTFPF